MNRFKSYLLASGGVVVLATTISLTSTGRAVAQRSEDGCTQICSSFERPVWTRDVNNGMQPFSSQIVLVFNEGSPVASGTFAAVPAGKRLVVEHVSVEGGVPGNQRFFAHITGDGGQQYSVVLSYQATFGAGGASSIYTASQPMKVYVNAGTPLNAFANRNNTSGSSNIVFTISGYFVDVP